MGCAEVRFMVKPPQKITFGEMREMGLRGVLEYCSDYHCSHWTAISGDPWPDDVRLSDIERRFTCQAYGTKRADLHWEREDRQAVRAHKPWRLRSSFARN